jgi:hypothetical protein
MVNDPDPSKPETALEKTLSITPSFFRATRPPASLYPDTENV